jgi:hypothetical protein
MTLFSTLFTAQTVKFSHRRKKTGYEDLESLQEASAASGPRRFNLPGNLGTATEALPFAMSALQLLQPLRHAE